MEPYSIQMSISFVLIDIDSISEISIARLWIDIDPIFNTKIPFHVFWRYWSHIQGFHKIPCHVFWKSGVVGPRLFQTFQNARFPKFWDAHNHIFRNRFVFSWFLLKYIGVPKNKSNWFWESWSRPLGPKTMIMMGFRVFLKWILKVTIPKWGRIILRSFWAIHFIIFTIKWPPKSPSDPKSNFFPDFLLEIGFLWACACHF